MADDGERIVARMLAAGMLVDAVVASIVIDGGAAPRFRHALDDLRKTRYDAEPASRLRIPAVAW